jgi:eukaryotic-like serine/threonine-protein kinase
MAVLTRCPPPGRLLDLVHGLARPTDEADLLAHLDACSGCQGQLDALIGASPELLTVVRQAGKHSRYEDPCWQLLRAHLEDKTLLAPDDLHPDWSVSSPDVVKALNSLEGYEIKRSLGEGGMGLVFEATEGALRRSVAIKVLSPRLAGDPVARQRFAREAQAAAAVRHPNVVTIHAVSTVAGLPYLVMEYCAGGSLQDWLDRHEPLDWQTVAELGEQVASGLAAAHARGLVHRDIKPSNILLQAEGWPREPSPIKIGDFGLAQVADESRLTETGQVAGTPMYMAPEQALGGALDGRADLFSLGSVLYALSTGQEPFPGGSPLVVLRQVSEMTPLPVRQLNQAIPPWLAALITRLHARQPAERFRSAADVADLFRYNLQHPEAPRIVPPPRTDNRSLRKRFGLLALTICAGLLLAGGLLPGDGSNLSSTSGTHTSASSEAMPLTLRATLTGHKRQVSAVAFSPSDPATVATGSDDKTLRIWNANTGEERKRLEGHEARILAVSFRNNGGILVSLGLDGVIRQWDTATWKAQPGLTHVGGVRRLAFGADFLAVDGSNSQFVELWDLRSESSKPRYKLQPENQSTITALAFTPDGHTLATGYSGGQICLWDAASGKELIHFQGDDLSIRFLAFTPDGRKLASTGSNNKNVTIWEVPTGRRLSSLSAHNSNIQSMAFSPDAEHLAIGDREGGVQILDMRTGRVLAQQRAHNSFVWALAFSPDGKTLATAGEDHLVRLWDLTELPSDQVMPFSSPP